MLCILKASAQLVASIEQVSVGWPRVHFMTRSGERRSEREATEDAVVERFVALKMPGAPWKRLPRGEDPPDYVVNHAGGRIGVELTEVLPERMPDNIKVVTVTGPRRESDTSRGDKALHQNSVRGEIERDAETRYTGPPAIVMATWDVSTPLANRDVPKLAGALADVVATVTARAPAGRVMLEWEDLAPTHLSGFINRLRVDWGGPISQAMWSSGVVSWGVTHDAIQRTIKDKEADLARWSVPVRLRWLLLTLSIDGEHLFDSAFDPTYTTSFDAVLCCDARGRFVTLSVQHER